MTKDNRSTRYLYSDEDLAARLAAAVGVARRTMATAIVVSATDGEGRAFSGGKLVLQINPDGAHGHISLND